MVLILAIIGAFSVAAVALYFVVGRHRYGGRHPSELLRLGASEGALRNSALRPELCRTVRVYFIKPSRYDDEGYVQFFRYGVQPNNTLTVLKALNESFNLRNSTKRNVYLETVIWDEICDGAVSPATITSIKEKAAEDGVELLIGMSGVQSNQYPRGRDLALQFVAEGVTTLMGGFHVSGYPDSCKFLNSVGVTTIVGEAENLWGFIVEDFLKGELKPQYSVTEGIRAKTGQDDIIVPLITEAQLPTLDDRYLTRFFNPNMTTLDTSRGCPFTCSYCSVKNVMGRTMRSRDPQAVVRWIRDAGQHHGIDSLFIVDDDFFRSPSWEPILEGMADYRRQGNALSFMMQVDAEAAAFDDLKPGEQSSSQRQKCERFLRLSAEAGCYSAFVGFETFNPQNLLAVTKVQNLEKEHRQRKDGADVAAALQAVKEKYRRVCRNWHRQGVAVHRGYLIGLPFHRPREGRQPARGLLEGGGGPA